ncbi:hypothetical protein DID88_001405 [Monilinia fructigena]|uniref:BOD1/SHG1 domain-containing protein n=1 Tax=Monilinia fructigena TaxID=38457 RepID=A0A395IYD8_9HELO|nr:hypothetical protein DID88_001405 [Monilinia fructigena]
MASSYNKDSGMLGLRREESKDVRLPLASATRAAIEGLAHTYKKKGTYDELKTKIWQDLENGDFEEGFSRSLLNVAEEQLEKDPRQLLRLDRNKAMLLIEGAVDRAGPYQTAGARIEKLIQAYVPEIEKQRTREEERVEEKRERSKEEKEKEIADEKRKQEKLKRREEEKRIEQIRRGRGRLEKRQS